MKQLDYFNTRSFQQSLIVNSKQEKKLISFVKTPPEIACLMTQLINKPKNSKILDVGCGKGVFLKNLLSSGFKNIDGIEINKELFNFCKINFHQASLFNKDYLLWNPPSKYDAIIGNPPYAHYNALPEQLRLEVFGITGTRESDIYYAFIIKSIELLKEEGELIFIVPYGFFYNTHAEIVRKKIIESGCINTIIDLDEARLFNGENPETVILKFVKSKGPESLKTKIIRLKTKNASVKEISENAVKLLNNPGIKENELFEYYEKPIFKEYKEPWSSYPEIKISSFITLKDIACVAVGMVSGFEKTFRLKNNESKNYSKKEKELIVRLIKASNCAGFWIEGNVRYIIPDKRVKNENGLKNNYPNIYNKLSVYKNEMKKRYLPNKNEWFRWQALRNKEKLEKYLSRQKIFVPALDRTKENRFSLTNDRIYPSADVLAIIPLKIDPLFLLGYLNSDFFRTYYLTYGARKGQRIAFTQKILSNIKIPIFSEEIANKITNITENIIKTKDASKRKLIDEIIIGALRK